MEDTNRPDVTSRKGHRTRQGPQNAFEPMIAGDQITPPFGAASRIREYYRKDEDDIVVLESGEEFRFAEASTFPVVPCAGPLARLGSPRSCSRLQPSAELRERFDALIEKSTEPWTEVMPDLATQLDAWGYDLWVVGGAVRDLLLGAEPDRVDDLDVAGTTPPALLKRIFSGVVAAKPELGGWTPRLSSSEVMHLFAGPTGENGWGVYDTFFQHLTLRSRYDRENSRWCSGADLLADHEFRDVGFNSIFYSVRDCVLIAPDAAALEDFGLTPEGIETWSVNTAKGLKLRIRPIAMPTPSDVPDDWGIKGLSRVVKAVDKFPDSDPTPIRGWLDASGHHFRHDFQRNRTRRRSAEQVLASYLVKAKIKQRTTTIDLLAERGFDGEVLDALEAALGVRRRAHLGETDQVLSGWGLRELNEVNGALVVGEEVVPDLDLSPATVNALLLQVIGDEAAPMERPVTFGSTTFDAHVVESPSGWYVELDESGMPWRVDGDTPDDARTPQ